MGTKFKGDATSPVNDVKRLRLRESSHQYRVLLVNDDYTPMDFVVVVLQRFFAMTSHKAVNVMLDVHRHGSGICGIYTRDIAETKVAQVNKYARLNEHPLLCKMEKV